MTYIRWPGPIWNRSIDDGFFWIREEAGIPRKGSWLTVLTTFRIPALHVKVRSVEGPFEDAGRPSCPTKFYKVWFQP